MKPKILLFALVLTFCSAANAQLFFVVSGSVSGATSEQNLTATIPGTILSYDLVTDVYGNFVDTIPTDSNQGVVTVTYVDCNGNEQSDIGYWYPDNLEIPFSFVACPVIEECSAHFTIQEDPSGQNAGYVYVTSDVSGDDVTYFWNFGDGSASSSYSTTHYYSTNGTHTLCLTITTASGCTSEYCETFTVGEDGSVVLGTGMVMQGFTMVINDSTSGMNEVAANTFSVYPNPVTADGKVFITSPNAWSGELTAFDQQGRRIESCRLVTKGGATVMPLHVSDWTTGMYTIRMVSNNGDVSTIKVAR